MVATLGETTGYLALIRLQQKMLADPVGAEILRSESVQSHTFLILRPRSNINNKQFK